MEPLISPLELLAMTPNILGDTESSSFSLILSNKDITSFLLGFLKFKGETDTDFLKPDFEIMSPDAGPQQQLEADFEQTRLRKTILQLQDEHQQVITMRFIDELSYEEIASALNKTEGAIRVIQHRALKKMREILEGEKDRD